MYTIPSIRSVVLSSEVPEAVTPGITLLVAIDYGFLPTRILIVIWTPTNSRAFTHLPASIYYEEAVYSMRFSPAKSVLRRW